MTLMRIHCPACEAVSEVTDSQTRCGRCGRLFDRAATLDDTAKPGTERWVPPPPSVIYQNPGSHRGQASPPTPGFAQVTDRPPPSPTRAEPPGDTPEPPPGERAAALTGETTPVPLGPPPPYRPIVAAHRPTPVRAEMTTTPAAPLVNIRVHGALGPPPPYRPIIQGGAVFERGPPPDLEPWRQASITRIPAPSLDLPAAPEAAEPTSNEWSLIREPEPEIVATPELEQTIRLEGRRDFEPNYGPLIWPAAAGGQTGVAAGGFPSRSYRNPIRRMLWAGAVLTTVIVLGLALDIGRGRVIRAFPGTVRIYAALGLAPNTSAK